MLPQQSKKSSLAGVELDEAVRSIQDLLDSNPVELSDDDVAGLEALLKKLESMADNAQSYSFSDLTHDHSEKMNISWSGRLELKPDAVSRAIKTDSVGADELWSADVLYRHLCVLQGLVPRKNEVVKCSMWIEAFLYRLAAMTPSTVLSVEQSVCPSTDRIKAATHSLDMSIVWAIVMSRDGVGRFIDNHHLHKLKKEESVLFISEAKGPNQLKDYVSQAVGEMHAWGRIVEKDIIRGILTNGHSWIFLILTLHKDGGGSFLRSTDFYIRGLQEDVVKEAVSAVSAIMAYWVIHSHESLDVNDDYFTDRNA